MLTSAAYDVRTRVRLGARARTRTRVRLGTRARARARVSKSYS